jgi:hypothetical protein
MRRRFPVGLLSVILCAGALPAAAQVTASTQAIGQCLCDEQRLSLLHADLDAAQQQFDSEKERVAALDGEIEQARPNVNVNDPEQVDAFRRLVNSREQAYATLYHVNQPHLAEVTLRYNRATDRYNGRCAGRPVDSMIQAEVRARLVCPVESAD